MKKLIDKKMMKNLIICFSTIFCAEIIFMLVSSYSLFNMATIRIIITSLLASFIISFIGSFMCRKIRYIFTLIILFLVSFYIFLQLSFINYLGVYASINASSQLGAVTDYIFDFFKDGKIEYFLVFIPFIISLIYIIFNKTNELEIKMLDKSKRKRDLFSKVVTTGIVFSALTLIFYGTLNVNSNMTINLFDLFKYPSVPTTSVKSFGVLAFGYSDLKAKLLGIEEEFNIINIEKTTSSTTTERKFDDTLWNEVINTETNEEMKVIHNYLINNDSTSKNDMTGLFEGKNVIFIMMESVNDIITKEEYYPNFSKLMDNAWYFENAYSPRNSCPTGNNEFSGMTSIYSIYNSCTVTDYEDNIYPESIFNLFKEEGYTTSSMHNYTEAYYPRSTFHIGMGSDIYYGVQDLGIRYGRYYGEWSSDEEFGEVAMDLTLNKSDEPFMLWMTTVSAHQPFTTSSIEGDLYYDLFESTGYSNGMKRYMSKVKVTDDMFGVLLERLEKAKILDDTVIVVYDDHYAYGLDEDELAVVLNRSMDGYESDRTPMLIYNSSIEGEVISDYTTFMNIVPTVANLFDLNYDPRLYFGKDMFSPEYKSRAVFSDGSWKNEDAYYDAPSGTLEYFSNITYTEDELNYINAEISNEMKISTMIIQNDYYNYLYKALDEKKEESNNQIAIE